MEHIPNPVFDRLKQAIYDTIKHPLEVTRIEQTRAEDGHAYDAVEIDITDVETGNKTVQTFVMDTETRAYIEVFPNNYAEIIQERAWEGLGIVSKFE